MNDFLYVVLSLRLCRGKRSGLLSLAIWHLGGNDIDTSVTSKSESNDIPRECKGFQTYQGRRLVTFREH